MTASTCAADTGVAQNGAPESARHWLRVLRPYRTPHHGRSAVELLITAGPLLLVWVLMWLAYAWDQVALCLLLALPAAGFLVRLFMIQHDCGHGALFRHRALNDWTGRVIGVFTLTPYDYWRRTHAVHHATAGNLDRRGTGDVDTLTVAEYLALGRWRRLAYRLGRNPFVMFGIGPTYLFFVKYRLPVGLMGKGWEPWVSTMATNLAIGAVAASMMWLLGVVPFLVVHVPATLLAASIGVWLFYVQHQFEETTWANDGQWDFSDAALHGSSYYELPGVLRWFSANIGVHHVHHLCSTIPFYRLRRVVLNHPELGTIGRLTLLDSLRCVRLALWDEGRKRLVSFKSVHA